MTLRPHRVLFLDHSSIIGGAQLALVNHLRALDRARFQPHVACTDAIPALVARYRDAGAEVHIVPLPRLRHFDPRVLPRLVRSALILRGLVRRLDVDLVVANTSRTAYTAAVALRGTRVPLVWWTRDFFFNRFVFGLLKRFVTRVICVADAIRRYYGGEGDERFEVINVGSNLHADLEQLSAEVVRRERERWGFTADDVVVGFMGRLVADKGPQDLIEAIAMIHRRNPRVKVLLVGTGEGQAGDVEAQLHALVARHEWTFATFAGFQDAEATYYRLFDVFVLPSRGQESYATSVVQAMMAGTPVIATATGGTAELVRDGQTGLLVPPGSPTRIADAIGVLLSDHDKRDRMRRAAHDHVMRNNREADTTRRAERCYEEAIAHPSRHSR
jgi:glycosyltransferase involved in cell wall biosynthesis